MATKEEAIRALVEYATSGNQAEGVRVAAVEGLGYAGGFYACDVLMSIVTGNYSGAMKQAAARALGHAVATKG